MFEHKIDEDLSLRLIEYGDEEEVFRLIDGARDYLREWLGFVDITKSVDDTKRFIDACKKGYADSKNKNVVILFRGEIVGVGGFNDLDWTNRIAKMGYWLSEKYQGQGIITRVARALTDYALDELKMNKVEIRAAEGNVKSRAVPERLGYVKEGRIRAAERLYDHYVDHIVYGMLAEEWKKGM
ncbi:RimJ/RimL family protein N-acetyltransferase [Halalkalibacillus sediminis]|uniref:RimJ/RimL family protein N-acetyltransferase n=1 Tax=Halalkalibacillus sediminis TaxID=2018042 RepID=A0A2I0QUG2_9BACI|nr:GNAT family protein [Halalkalibacillus sediminis]PKR77730.1 RimJ/RimL family protein N-acetyltransferase [Halalkalibacillus sediminis]